MSIPLRFRTRFFAERFGALPRQISIPAQPDLRLVVVIPCYDEPDLLLTLDSLRACALPDCALEVIVVVNSGANCEEAVRKRNTQTALEASEWARTRSEPGFACYVIDCPDLPPKQAGVGLARKIGMDEAAFRLDDVNALSDGVIACLDADCQCDPTYLQSLVTHFRDNPRTPGCSIYFEHPIDETVSPDIREAIARYELHLRYYVQALRYARFPFAFHTVGSAMAVRANVYLEQGGMNKRQAGEDFYFLHKIMPRGGYTDLLATRVIPSPRVSHRVPFGTGRAMRDFLEAGRRATYPFEAFVDLKRWLETVDLLHSPERGPTPQRETGSAERTTQARGATQSTTECSTEFLGQAGCSPALQEFLKKTRFAEAVVKMRANSASLEAFRKRFFGWFDGFAALKWIHYARDFHYGPGELAIEPARLLRQLGRPAQEHGSTTELLLNYRALDREGPS